MWRKGFENDIPNASEQELMPYVRRCLSMKIEGEIPVEAEVPFDLFVRNEGTLDDLHRKVDEIVVPVILRKWKYLFN